MKVTAILTGVVMMLVCHVCHASAQNGIAYSQIVALPQATPTASHAYGSDPLQTVSVWRTDATLRGSVVFIHGGCWLSAYDMQHSVGFMSHLAELGFDVIGIEYRRAGNPGGGWPGTYRDIQTALQMVLDDVVKDDNKPRFLLGHSAGGHLALLAAQQFSGQFSSIIGLAAITDIKAYARGKNSCQAATPEFMGGTPEQRGQQYDEANPRSYALPDNVILLQGDGDNIVPVSQADWPDVARFIVPEAGHFDWLYPDSAAFAQLYDVLIQGE